MIIKDELSSFFYDRLANGELFIQQCITTGRFQWYPRSHSLYADGGVQWVKAAGTGKLFSYCRMHRGPAPAAARYNPPVILALVELTEGPIMLARIANSTTRALKIGEAVTLVTPHASAANYPIFEATENTDAQYLSAKH